MLDFNQFAFSTAAERFTLQALQRRLTFSNKLRFPELSATGKLMFVEGSNKKLVWGTMPATVIVTSKFSILNLHDQCMALSEPEAIRETFNQVLQNCPDAYVDELLRRFQQFTPPDPTDISRAYRSFVDVGIVKERITVNKHLRRAVFNMRLVAATRSGILRGMIAAEDYLRRFEGTEVLFSVDLRVAEPPVKRNNSTHTGRARKLNRAEYQSKYHSEQKKLIAANRRISQYEINGYLTKMQYAALEQLFSCEGVPDDLLLKIRCSFDISLSALKK